MHFGCKCENSISDTTDFIPGKAHFIPDMDYYDVVNEIQHYVDRLIAAKEGEEFRIVVSEWIKLHFGEIRPLLPRDMISFVIGKAQRSMYQCSECGRIHLDSPIDSQHLISFVPDETPASDEIKQVLNSVHKEKWKRPLIANWFGGAGKLSWQNNYPWNWNQEEFSEWNAFEKRYHEVFEELKSKGLLRSSFLRRDKTIVHSWDDCPFG